MPALPPAPALPPPDLEVNLAPPVKAAVGEITVVSAQANIDLMPNECDWNFGDGRVEILEWRDTDYPNGKVIFFIPKTAGPFSITATVTDIHGRTATSAPLTINVEEPSTVVPDPQPPENPKPEDPKPVTPVTPVTPSTPTSGTETNKPVSGQPTPTPTPTATTDTTTTPPVSDSTTATQSPKPSQSAAGAASSVTPAASSSPDPSPSASASPSSSPVPSASASAEANASASAPVSVQTPVPSAEPTNAFSFTGVGMDRVVSCPPASGKACTVDSLLANIDLNDGSQARVLDQNGQEVDPLHPLGTGLVVEIRDKDGNVIDKAPVVVPGDVLGTGQMSLTQLVRVASAFIGKEPLEGPYLKAADFTGSGSITLTDLVKEAQLMLEASAGL